MIQEIGLIIGIYIVIRMLRILIPPEGMKEAKIMQIFAAIAIAGILFLMLDLVSGGIIRQNLNGILGK